MRMCRFCMEIILALSWLFIMCCLQAVAMVFINLSVWKFNSRFGKFKVKFYWMTFFVYFIYEGFKCVLWFSLCHKNIVHKAQIAAGFVFNERIEVSLFELGYEYVFVCRGAYCSHSTAFDLKVKFWVKNKLFSVKISAKNVVITFVVTVFFV